jgi:hypothetical protein
MVRGGKDAVTTKLTFIPITHPDEDVLENYAFNRLSDLEVSEIEEHLLICEECQRTFAATDEYVQLMKAGTAAYIAKHAPGSPPRVRLREEGLRWNAAAAAILLLTCLTALLSWRAPLGVPQTIELNALRGDSPSNISQAPAWQPLDLQIDLKEVRPAAGYRVEVVDATGRRVWFGGTPARLTKGLSPGVYWVRLSTDAGEYLREYGLSIAAPK